MDIEHMREVYNYVYATKPKSKERERRLAEISEKDREQLYEFDMMVLSGRLKEYENEAKQSEVSSMSKTKKIESYEDFKKMVQSTKGYVTLRDFHQNHPDLYQEYSDQLEKERSDRSRIYG